MPLQTKVQYTNLPGTWGGLISQRRNGVSSFHIPDMQGHTRQLTDINGNVTDTFTPNAWGVQKASSGSTVNPYKSFGQWGYFTESPTRQYVRARHLNHDVGRWLSRDPYGLDGKSNTLYQYAGSSPLMYFDPLGLTCDTKNKPSCPKGWVLLCASSWQCGEIGYGTTCLSCGVTLQGGCSDDPCRCPNYKPKPHSTCHCPHVIEHGLGGSANRAAAIKGKDRYECGKKYLVRLPNSTDLQTVTIVDNGPHANNADIDLHISVFNKTLHDTYWVCIMATGPNEPKIKLCPHCYNKTGKNECDDCGKYK